MKPPDGYEYGDLYVMDDIPYEREAARSVWECARCGAIIKDIERHDSKCPKD